jgi:hypothetical protein
MHKLKQFLLMTGQALLVSSTLATNVALAQKSPTADKATNSYASYFNGMWPSEPGIAAPVVGGMYAIPGAIGVDVVPSFHFDTYVDNRTNGGVTEYAFFTKCFFEQSQFRLPKDAIPVQGLQYRYYKPSATEPASRLQRGSGRDYLLVPRIGQEKAARGSIKVRGPILPLAASMAILIFGIFALTDSLPYLKLCSSILP